MKVPQTRKEAQAKDAKHYFTGKPCKHGHVSLRYAKTGYCVECKGELNQRFRKPACERAVSREAAIVRRNLQRQQECQAFIEKWLETHKAK